MLYQVDVSMFFMFRFNNEAWKLNCTESCKLRFVISMITLQNRHGRGCNYLILQISFILKFLDIASIDDPHALLSQVVLKTGISSNVLQTIISQHLYTCGQLKTLITNYFIDSYFHFSGHISQFYSWLLRDQIANMSLSPTACL